MQRIIYIDSIFMENLIMDYLLLTLTVKTMKGSATFLQRIRASLIGSVGYCTILCLPGTYWIKVTLLLLPLTAVMLAFCMKTTEIPRLLQGMGVLLLFSFFVGGIMLKLLQMFSFFNSRFEISLLLLSGYIGYLLCMRVIVSFRREKAKLLYKVMIPNGREEIVVYGLADTGNGLVEPISGKGAAILEEAVWKRLKELKRPEKLKLLPFHSIGKENGMLKGYEIDKIVIETCPGSQIEKKQVIIAETKGRISAHGSYQMILPMQWIEE